MSAIFARLTGKAAEIQPTILFASRNSELTIMTVFNPAEIVGEGEGGSVKGRGHRKLLIFFNKNQLLNSVITHSKNSIGW